jgi:hypothetical protein
VLGWLGDFLVGEVGGKASSLFHCRLVPPRPDFAFTMTDEEKALMKQHSDYLRGRLGEGGVILFDRRRSCRPVGPGIVRADDEAGVSALTDGDPTVRSGLGFRYEILP